MRPLGPFLELFVNEAKIGSEIVSDQTLNIRIKVQAASWIDVNQGTLFANGEAIEQFDIRFDKNSNTFEWEKEITVDRDTWFVAYVKGDVSMFPVAAPIDVPPVLLNEVFGSIAAPLGFGGDTLGALTPSMMGVFKPLALTNPIWVDHDGDGFDAPGLIPRVCKDGYVVQEEVESTNSKITKSSAELDTVSHTSQNSEGATRRVSIDAPFLKLPLEWQEKLKQKYPNMKLRSAADRKRLHKKYFTNSFGFPRLKGDLKDVRVLFEGPAMHQH